MNISRRASLIIAVMVVTLLIVAVLYFSFTAVSRSDKNAVEIDVFPKDASITLNNQAFDRGTAYLKTGVYDINVSREGFTSYSDTISINPGKKIIVASLQPVTDEAKKITDENSDHLNRIRELSDKRAKEFGEHFYKKNPIASKLPYKSFIYTIGYRVDPSDQSGDSIIIEIDAPEGYKQSALYRIRELGYDPTDFTILFRDYENPFSL